MSSDPYLHYSTLPQGTLPWGSVGAIFGKIYNGFLVHVFQVVTYLTYLTLSNFSFVHARDLLSTSYRPRIFARGFQEVPHHPHTPARNQTTIASQPGHRGNITIPPSSRLTALWSHLSAVPPLRLVCSLVSKLFMRSDTVTESKYQALVVILDLVHNGIPSLFPPAAWTDSSASQVQTYPAIECQI